MNFEVIKSWLKVNTLEEILNAIKIRRIIFLDIKNKKITAEDLKKICEKFNQEYWIASRDLQHLGQFKFVFKNYKFVYNSGFLFLKKGVEQAGAQGVDVIKVFRWQLTPNLESSLLQFGIRFNIHPWFMDTKEYLANVEKYGSVWVAYDDLNRLDKPWIWS